MTASRLQFELSQSDYDALFRFQATTPEKLKTYKRGRWVVSGYSLLLVGYLFLSGSPVWWWWVMLFWLPAFLFIGRMSEWEEFRRLRYIRNDPDGKHLGLTVLKVEDDKLVYAPPDGTIASNVSQISEIGETDTHYFLPMGRETAIVPKTAHGTDSFILELRQHSDRPNGTVVTVTG